MSSLIPPDPSSPDQFKQKVLTVLGEVLNNPLHPLLDQFRASIPGYLEINPPTLPITQITGFSKFTSTYAAISVSVQSTSSTVYADLATTGPLLSSLQDGNYVIFHGTQARIQGTAGPAAFQSLSINSAAASDANAARTPIVDDLTSVMTAVVSQLKSGTNTVQAKYRTSDATKPAQFQYRWVLALKYSNL